MNIETIRDYCLSLPMASEDMAFGDDHLLFRVCGKIFACCDLKRKDYFVLKCAPEYALYLRERYSEVEPAWHWNKKHWNQLRLDGNLSERMIKSLICHSYEEVVKKLPKLQREEHLEITGIKSERIVD